MAMAEGLLSTGFPADLLDREKILDEPAVVQKLSSWVRLHMRSLGGVRDGVGWNLVVADLADLAGIRTEHL